jgi:hypothetical protein
MASSYQASDYDTAPIPGTGGELFEPPAAPAPRRRGRGTWENAEKRVARLRTAHAHSRRLLQPFRDTRLKAVKQYATRHYADKEQEPVPVNLIKLYANIVVRHLVPQTPRAMIAARPMKLKQAAAGMESHTNRRLQKMRIDEAFRRCTLDALFCLGIGKVALADPAEADIDNRKTAGEAFFETIDLDDWVHDMGAKIMDKACFQAHRYRMPLEFAKDFPLFTKNVRENLTASTRTLINEDGDDRIDSLSMDSAFADEYEDHVELWEIFLRKERLIITLAADDCGPSGMPLRVQEWIGPGCGPYHFLAFNDVPGNSMPSAPLHDLIDLHMGINGVYRKLGRQADRQKKIGLVGPGQGKDGKLQVESNDGDMLSVDNPDGAREIELGGINQQNLAFGIHMRDVFSYQAGNLDLLGGLSPQSSTLGQDKMLQENASVMIRDMQGREVAFTRGVLTALGWYWWTNPFDTYHVRHTLPGFDDMEVWSELTPEQRAEPFEELDFDIDPFSLQDDSPSSRLQLLNQLMMQVLLPAAQVLEAQGITVDFEAYLKLVGKFGNMPNLNEIVRFAGLIGPEGVEPGRDEGAGYSPAQTTRRYERVNRPGGTRFGKDNAMMQTLLGAGTQESEMGAVLKPTG